MKCSHTIQLGAVPVPYTLHKRRGVKKYTLSVRRDGRITLTVPWWVSKHAAQRYIEEKREWLTKALQVACKRGGISQEERAEHYAQHKESARAFVERRLVELNAHYGFSWGRVAIRKNATCWGSCSSKQNLNFDYRILFLPPHLQDYVLVHELCHLKEMNHSPRFWALVAHVVPNHKHCRDELRAAVR